MGRGVGATCGRPGGCQVAGSNAPPIGGVTKSAQLRFRLRRKLRPLPLLRLSPRDPLRWARAWTPFGLAEKKTGRARSKRKERLAQNLRMRAGLLIYEGLLNMC